MQRTHIHIFVQNLQENINYYSTLFNTEPTFVDKNYAQWKLDNPALNFAISYNADTQGIHHLGIEMESPDALKATTEQLLSNGFTAREQKNTECCYARSDKSWPQDPQGVLWEIFYNHDKHHSLSLPDLDDSASNDEAQHPAACCSDPSCACSQESLATCCIS